MRLFVPSNFIDIIAFGLFIIGAVILFLSTIKLNKDLVSVYLLLKLTNYRQMVFIR